MRVLHWRAALALAAHLTLAPAAAAQTALSDPEYLELGRKSYDWFLGAQFDSLMAHTAADTWAAVGGTEGMQQRLGELYTRAGTEVEFVEEKMTRRRGNPQYWREARYSNFTDEPIVFRWVFNEQGEITGMGLGPRSRTPEPD
jgi:hypothetical protein